VTRFRSRPLVVWATVGIAAAVAALLIGRACGKPRWNDGHPVGHQAVITHGTHPASTLGPASHLRYQSDFAAARDLYLDGEAYFQVARDTLRPFRVHTAHSVTEEWHRVVVRAYADQVRPKSSVHEGRVALWHADTGSAPRGPPPPALVLDARDLGRLDAGGSAGLRRGVNVDRYSRGPRECSRSMARRSAMSFTRSSGGTTSTSRWGQCARRPPAHGNLPKTSRSIWL